MMRVAQFYPAKPIITAKNLKKSKKFFKNLLHFIKTYDIIIKL